MSKYQVIRMTLSGRIAWIIFAVALIGIVSMPWWASQGLIRDVVTLACYIAVAQMWNMLAGYGGLVSVGQQAFVGVAAYAMFVLAQTYGVNPYSAVFISLLAPAALAVPIYYLLHRLEGPYFAIGTWVVAEALRLLATNMPMLNGGAGMSLRVMTQFSVHERAIASSLLAALLLLVTLGGSYLVLRSRYGIAMTAMRDNPAAAASQGVNVHRLRFYLFVAAAVGSGFAGAVYFMAQLRITPPSAFGMNWANLAIFIVMVGGIGSLEGVLIGAVIFFFAERWFGEYGASYLIVLGLMTLACALYFRGGLWGFYSRHFNAPWFPTRRHLVRSNGVTK